MRRFFVFFVAVLAGAGMVSAQTLESAERSARTDTTVSCYNPFGWEVGVYGGITLNTLSTNVGYMTNVQYAPAFGNTLGIDVTYGLRKWLAVRADLALTQKNNTLLHYVYYESTNNGETTLDSASFGTNSVNRYVNLPVVLDFSFGGKARFHAYFGGYIGYWIDGHRSGGSLPVLGSEGEFNAPYEFNKVRDNRFDAGMAYGLGLSFLCWNHFDISFEMHLYYALTDMQKNYMLNMNPRYNTTTTLQLGLAYKF